MTVHIMKCDRSLWVQVWGRGALGRVGSSLTPLHASSRPAEHQGLGKDPRG